MADPTFMLQIWLSVIDKLLLGGVAGVLGFLAAKRLEAYRARQTLRAEIARKRVEVLADIWKQIAEYENHCFQQGRTLGVMMLDALKEAGIAAPSEEAAQTMEGVLAQVSRYGGHDLPDSLEKRLVGQMVPHTNALLTRGNGLKRLLAENRFWLGTVLNDRPKRYCQDVTDAFARLTPSHDDRLAFQRALKDLMRRRDEAATIIDQVLDD